MDFLETHLHQAGLDCKRLGPGVSRAGAPDSSDSLLATYGSGELAVYFHGHYDVVPAQTRAQFQPQRKEHFLFGRGSADMKGGIVAMLYAIRALKQIGVELKGRIGLMLVPNEETGGMDGTAWLAQQGLLGRDGVGMLLAEPTSGVVWNANRGAISLHVRVFGKPAHVGLQHQGENAFERMHAFVEKLQQLKREVEQRKTRFNIGSEQTRNSILMLGDPFLRCAGDAGLCLWSWITLRSAWPKRIRRPEKNGRHVRHLCFDRNRNAKRIEQPPSVVTHIFDALIARPFS